MQLAGDAGALLGDRPARALLLLEAEPLVLPLSSALAVAGGPAPHAGRPGGADEREHEGQVAEVRSRRPASLVDEVSP